MRFYSLYRLIGMLFELHWSMVRSDRVCDLSWAKIQAMGVEWPGRDLEEPVLIN